MCVCMCACTSVCASLACSCPRSPSLSSRSRSIIRALAFLAPSPSPSPSPSRTRTRPFTWQATGNGGDQLGRRCRRHSTHQYCERACACVRMQARVCMHAYARGVCLCARVQQARTRLGTRVAACRHTHGTCSCFILMACPMRSLRSTTSPASKSRAATRPWPLPFRVASRHG